MKHNFSHYFPHSTERNVFCVGTFVKLLFIKQNERRCSYSLRVELYEAILWKYLAMQYIFITLSFPILDTTSH